MHESLFTNNCKQGKITKFERAHHMPLKLFFTLHEIETKLTEVQLPRVIIFWWKRREVPCLNLISSKFYSRYIFHFSKFFMFT